MNILKKYLFLKDGRLCCMIYLGTLSQVQSVATSIYGIVWADVDGLTKNMTGDNAGRLRTEGLTENQTS